MSHRLVKDVMNKPVVTIDEFDTLRDIRDIFTHVRFHHLLVINEGKRVIGIISDRDYLKAISPFLGTASERPSDEATLNRRAHLFMSHKIITVTPDAIAEDAAHLLLDHDISCLPVVGKQGEAIGILTWKDLLRSCLRRDECWIDE